MIGTMAPGEALDGVELVVETVGGGFLMPTYVVTEFKDPLATITPRTPHTPGELEWKFDIEYYLEQIFNDIILLTLDNVSIIQSLSTYWAMGIFIEDYIGLHPDKGAKDLELQKAKAFIMSFGVDETKANFVIDIMRETGDGLIEAFEDPFTGIVYVDLAMAYYWYMAYEQGFISTDGRFVKTTVIMTDEPMSNRSMATIDEIRSVMASIIKDDGGAHMLGVWVTGSAALTYDISKIVNSEFRWIELGVVILIFLLLFFVLKSYLTPLRAILTILMSIAWTIGLTHLLFGHILDIPVLWMIPIILLVVCLGLGMDYDILLTTRIRENVLKGMSNDEAIMHALEKSGAVITICGLIMAGTFSTLMLSSSPMLQEFGFALGVAILLDALIIRTYVVPALMHLMGDWNWKGPKWMHKKDNVPKEIEEPTDAAVNE